MARHAAALWALVSSSSRLSAKPRDAGVKVSGPRLGVTRYVVPVSKPLWVHKPDASVWTGGGSAPVPTTREKVIVTPGSGPPPIFTTPAAGNEGPAASARPTR